MYGEEYIMLDVFSYTSAGGRSHNEDTIAYRTENGHGLFVVADGLGGHSRGEVASGCVARVMLNDWSPDPADSGEEGREFSRRDWLCNKFREANRAVLDLQKEHGRVMKSTAVALAIDDDKACWAHAGDSRLYYIECGDSTRRCLHALLGRRVGISARHGGPGGLSEVASGIGLGDPSPDACHGPDRRNK